MQTFKQLLDKYPRLANRPAKFKSITGPYTRKDGQQVLTIEVLVGDWEEVRPDNTPNHDTV